MPVPGPHKVHVAASVDKYRPTGQPISERVQRPSLKIIPDALQSEALTGHMVMGSSALLMQQHRRVRLETAIVQEEFPDDRAKHFVPDRPG